MQTICHQNLANETRYLLDTCHVPDKGSMRHIHRLKGGAETLHLGVGPWSEGIPDRLAHDG